MDDPPTQGTPDAEVAGTNPFWDFSLTVYRNDAVRTACLDAQDTHAANVNLLLLCCWLGFVGIKLTPEGIRRLDTLVDGWRQEAVQPLRALRRRLKETIGPVPGEMSAGVRALVKQAELEAERIEQALLYTALKALPGRDGRDAERGGLARQNLQLYALECLDLPSAAAMRGPIEQLLEGCRAAVAEAQENDEA